jgi:hypothetical protein
MHKGPTLCLVVGFLSLAPANASVTFSPFTPNNPIGGAPIGFAYIGTGFVGSVQRDGTNVLYSTDLNGGNVQPFASSVSLLPNDSSEHYVASSLGLGGFPSRDVYVASGNGVEHITHDGSSGNVFVTGLNGNVRGILFDSVGTFGFNMLVTTDTGHVYEVNSAGVATLLANTGEDTEGLDVAPLGGNLGPFNGDLIVASEGSGNIRAIDPTTHALTILTNVSGAEELSVVPLDLGASGNPVEGMYGADYSVNVVKAGASQFAGLQGDIVVTGEFTHLVWDLHWNGTTFVATNEGSFPNQPEDGIFVTSTIIGTTVPEPSSVALLGSVLLLVCWRLRRRSNALS